MSLLGIFAIDKGVGKVTVHIEAQMHRSFLNGFVKQFERFFCIFFGHLVLVKDFAGLLFFVETNVGIIVILKHISIVKAM